jgi:hypothetical protein
MMNTHLASEGVRSLTSLDPCHFTYLCTSHNGICTWNHAAETQAGEVEGDMAGSCGCNAEEAIPVHLTDTFDVKEHVLALEENFPRCFYM